MEIASSTAGYGKDSDCMWTPENWGQQEVVPDKNFKEKELEQVTIFEERRIMQLIAASDTEHTNTLHTKTKNMKEPRRRTQQIAARESEQTIALTTINKNRPRPYRKKQRIANIDSLRTNVPFTRNQNIEEITRYLQEHHRIKQCLPKSYTEQTNTPITRNQSIEETTRCLQEHHRIKQCLPKSYTEQTNTPITRNQSIEETTRCLQEHHRIKQCLPKSYTEQTNTPITRNQNIEETTRCLPKPYREQQGIENSYTPKTNVPINRNKNIEETTRCLQGPCRKMPRMAVSDIEQTNKRWKEVPLLYNIFGQAERVLVSNVLQQLEIQTDKPSKSMDYHRQFKLSMVDPPTVLHKSHTGVEESGADDGDYEGKEKLCCGGGDLNEARIPNISHTGLSDIVTDVGGRVDTSGSSNILLDRNTVYNFLQLQEDRKTVSLSFINQNLPETAERFEFRPQVLSSQSFSAGSHCWDVVVRKSDNWRVGVCYPSIDRKGGFQSVIGNNKKSWCLSKSHDRYSVIHDRKETCLFGSISGGTVRVSLNYESGLISFYELGVSAQHLHTFTATFTEPLHAVLGVWRGCVKISGVESGGVNNANECKIW